MSSAIPIHQACERIGISRSKFYELLNNKEIQSVKIGRRRLVRVADLDRWLANLPSEPPAICAGIPSQPRRATTSETSRIAAFQRGKCYR